MTRQGSWPARGYPELKDTKCVLPKGFRLSMYGFEDYTRIKDVMHYHGFEG